MKNLYILIRIYSLRNQTDYRFKNPCWGNGWRAGFSKLFLTTALRNFAWLMAGAQVSQSFFFRLRSLNLIRLSFMIWDWINTMYIVT